MKKSHQIAMAIVLVLFIWMSLGVFKDSPHEKETQTTQQQEVFSVEVMNSAAQMIPKVIQAVGHVRPWQHTTLSAEVKGKVKSIHVQDGQWVEKGDVIISLHTDDRQAQLEKNQSLLAYQKSRYERSNIPEHWGLLAAAMTYPRMSLV